MRYNRFKRWLYKQLTGQGMEVVYIILVLSFLIFFSEVILDEGFELSEYFEFKVATSVSATYIISLIIRFFIKRMEVDIEDESKLTNDPGFLIKTYQYDKNFMIKRCNDSGEKEITFPIKKLVSREQFEKISIVDDKSSYSLPNLIEMNYKEIFEAHKLSDIYNSTMIRLDDVVVEKNTLTLKSSRTTYYNLLVTNRAMDHELRSNLTVRQLYEFGPSISPLNQSQMSNHVGFNIIFETIDEEFLLVRRKKNLSVGKNKYATSVSAALKSKYVFEKSDKLDLESLEYAIKSEIKDELGLVERDYNFIFINNLVMIYQDLVEGGKPQFLFYIKSDLNEKQFREKFELKGKSGKKDLSVDANRLLFVKRNSILLESNMLYIKNTNKKIYIQTQTAGCIAEVLNETNKTR